MTPMTTKILCDAIALADAGQTGYRIQQSHYKRFHGMRRMVDRLIKQGLVVTDQAGENDLMLIPTRRARELLCEQCEAQKEDAKQVA